MKISWTDCVVSPTDETSIIKSKGSCNRCGRVRANKLCKLCEVVAYCCKECYAYDWKHGGHKQICGILKEDSDGTYMATVRKLVRDLYKRVIYLMSIYKMELRLSIMKRTPGHCSLYSGEIAMVLMRRQTCFDYPLSWPLASEYYKDALRPWFQRYKSFLRSEGFSLSHIKGSERDGGCFLFRDKRSPSIDIENAWVAACIRSERLVAFAQKDHEICSGTWTGSLWLALEHDDIVFVEYTTRDMLSCIWLDDDKLWLRGGIWIKRTARMENATEVGRHFARTRAEVKEALGFTLRLSIIYDGRWDDDAILKTWVAAADGNLQVLLNWLDSPNDTDGAIERGDMDVLRWIRLKTLARKMSREQLI